MKLNKFFLAAFATIGLFASCVEDDPLSQEASLTIDGETTINLDDSKAQTVSVSFRSNRDWTAKTSDKWIDVSPVSGSASTSTQEIEITVLENKSYDRSGSVNLSIGTLTKTIKINQKGNAATPDGSRENPFDVAAAVAKCVETGETVTSQKYYTKGIVSAIKDATGIAQYGNVSFYITDDGAVGEPTLLVFQAYYLGGEKFTSEDQLKVGDEVTIYGALVNYKSNTPETDGKGSTSIVVLNGEEKYVEETGGDITTEPKGTGTAEDPFNAAAAIQKCQEIGTTASTEQYYVKGKVSTIKELSTQYGNATFYISDDGTTTDQFCIFRCKYIGGVNFTSEDQLKVGQEVVVKGALINYYGNTPEMNQGCVLISIDGEGSGSNPDPEPIEEPTEFTEVTVAQFLAAAEDNTWYKLSGQVTNIASETYGNLTLKDDSGEVFIYGVSSKFSASDNDQLFNTLGVTLGDILTIAVQRGSFNNNPQGKNAFYISHIAGELDLGEEVAFTKVSGEVTDWTGTYLIMMADGKAHATVSGKDLAATSDVLTETDGVIKAPETFAVNIAKEGDGWSIKLPNGKYLGLAHNSAASSDSPVVFNIENTDAGVKISAPATNNNVESTYYLYQNVNSSNGGVYFRFYVDKSSYDNYTLPTLYKK
ncbi:MAG: BACON domain-containing protein [Candidatus Cryptobacteroides sp.]